MRAAPTWLLILALTFGTILALVLPPGQVPDEYQHFGRAYALSDGQWFPTTVWWPKGIDQLFGYTSILPFHVENKLRPKELLAHGSLPLDEEEQFPKGLPASSVYSPLPYLFSAMGIVLARVVGLSPLGIFYAGRLSNLLAWTALVYLGLRRTPIFHWAFLLLLLTPMSLNQAASYSADSLTNAVSFLWICLVLELALDYKPFTWRRGAILLVFSILMPLTKPPYTALLLAAAIIPAARFVSQKRRISAFLVMLIIAVPLVIASAGINRAYYYSQLKFPGVDPTAQQAGILTHPQTFLKATLQTMIEDNRFMYESYVGILGWLDTRLPSFIYWSYPLVLLLVALLDSQPDITIEAWQKILFVLSGLLAFLLVAAGQWITWTPLDARKVSDIQGRYLIPVVAPILLGLYNHKLGWGKKALAILVPIYLLVILTLTLTSVVQRFYTLS